MLWQKLPDRTKKQRIRFWRIQKRLYLCNAFGERHFIRMKIRAFSSAGSEHLPYKQRVGGSNPSTPTFNLIFKTHNSFGRLAQLVQSICLTSRGSAVRIRQRPLQGQTFICLTFFLFQNQAGAHLKIHFISPFQLKIVPLQPKYLHPLYWVWENSDRNE